MSISNQRPVDNILITKEATAAMLEMIGCFLENADEERITKNKHAISELAHQQSCQLLAVQGHIGELEDKAYEYELLNRKAANP